LKAEEILKSCKKIVWPEVKSYLTDPKYPQSFRIPKKYLDSVGYHWDTVREYPLRKGKYLRPTLLILTAKALGVDINKVVKTAAAMQISEEWLLAHDDFEDDSLERRGAKALHKVYGNELAVNAGDTLHVIMNKILLDNEKILGKKAKAVSQEFNRMLMRTVLGQAVEIKWTKDNSSKLTDEDIYFIIDGKTSYYSIAGPMRLSAIIAGVNDAGLEKIAEFGKYLGRCFQIIDDVLDLTSDFRGLKKQTGNDIYEGKRTIILAHFLNNISGSDKEKVLKILAKKRREKTEKEVKWIISRMINIGSIEYAKKEAEKYKEKALEMFGKDLTFLKEKKAREELETLINFVLTRDH